MRLCFDAGDFKALQEQVTVLAKKHGLLKQAVTNMVQLAVQLLDKVTVKQAKLDLINCLRVVTEGKIYVEIERARLTRRLAALQESDGNINEAADTLQELQVETFGSMERREKTDFILEQMRLNMARSDYVRTQIIANKISIKYFAKDEVQDLKLRFYELMIQLALHDNRYLDVCKYYREVYTTKSVQENELKWVEILGFIIVFVALSPYGNEQRDLIHKIALDKHLEKVPLYKQLIKAFTTDELMRWPIIEQMYKVDLQKTFVFSQATPEGQQRWKDLHARIIEHNIRVISKYYNRITLKRLTQLLDLSTKDAEEFLTKLVSSKTIYAKIDRLDGVAVFTPVKHAEDVMNDWSRSVHDLLELVNKTTHLIAKEEMVHQISQISI